MVCSSDRAAKLRVYENAKVCVVNADDALTMPVRGGRRSLYQLRYHDGGLPPEPSAGRNLAAREGEKVLNVKEMKLTGQHNYTNALARVALADAVGAAACSSSSSLKH